MLTLHLTLTLTLILTLILTLTLTVSERNAILRRPVNYNLAPAEHLRIDISCPCRRASLYRPMIILACLSGGSGLVV